MLILYLESNNKLIPDIKSIFLFILIINSFKFIFSLIKLFSLIFLDIFSEYFFTPKIACSELFNISNFCFMTIHNEKMVYYGETINENADSYYMGYYIEGCFNAMNLKTGFNAVFVLG